MPIEVLDRNNVPQTEFTIGDLMTIVGDAVGDPQAYTLLSRLKSIADIVAAPRAPGDNHIGQVGGHTLVQEATSQLILPATNVAYNVGDLVADTVTPGLVSIFQFNIGRIIGGSGAIVGGTIQKSSKVIDNAAFRIHLFSIPPTFTIGGDNSPMTTVVVAGDKSYLGYIDILEMVSFSDVAWGSGAPNNSRGAITFVTDVQSIYGILEARGIYDPVDLEAFRVFLCVIQD